MTIRVDAEVFLQLSSRPGESCTSNAVLKEQPHTWQISPSPATVLKKGESYSEDLSDDDTLSTASLSDCGSEVTRTVSFHEELVTEVYTRPFTPPEQVEELYYSQEETSRFRQDYRLERKLLNGESLFDDEAAESPRYTKSISRVVVHDNDTELTAVYACEDDFDTAEFWSGSITWW